jgi:hypothetical protein
MGEQCAYYVVRLWSAPQGFRADVRDVCCERSVDFTSAGALAEFFAAARRQIDANAQPPVDERQRGQPR